MKAIAAMALNRAIGAGGRIPWHLPEDFRWFKRTTMGGVLVMGRKTYESLPGLLPGRTSVVLSRSMAAAPGMEVIRDPGELETDRFAGRDVWIIGGAEIYREFLPRCTDLYLTLVQREVEGDTFFPPFESMFEDVGLLLETPEFVVRHYRRVEAAG